MLKKLINNLFLKRSRIIVQRVSPYINKTNTLLDIGSGSGHVSFGLKKLGKDITALDIIGFQGPRIVTPIYYDGIKMPFPDNHFDTALLLMVMHHTPDPSIVFSEASRVANEIIVIETSFTSKINKFFTVILDALINLQFNVFWSSYKSDDKWLQFFEENKYQVVETVSYPDRILGIPFLHILYYLKNK